MAIRLRPRAKADRLVAVPPAAGGRQELVANVTEAPQNERANEALLQLLADAWQLRRCDLRIVAGAASRHKVVQITGDPDRVFGYVAGLIAALAAPEEAGI